MWQFVPGFVTVSMASDQTIRDELDSVGSTNVQPAAWDAYVPHSRARLVARQVKLSFLTKQSTASGVREKETRVNERLSQLASQFKVPDEGEEPQTRRFFLAGMSGIVASALLHVLLVVVLAVVTLKLPGPPAGLAFDAAASPEVDDVVEMTQPLDAQSPDATDSDEIEAFENQIDVTDQLSTSVTAEPLLDALGSVAAPVNRLSNAMSATSSMVKTSANASFFGAAAGGNCFCYVIDASGSMRGGPWEAARRELLKSLASLKPTQRFYIVMFTRSIEAIPEPGKREPAEHALYATQENLDHARRWLLGVQIGGSGAAPKACVEFAIEKEPDAIYLLTDGVTKVKDVADFIREKNRVSDLILGEQVRVPIHTIAFYSDRGQQLLRQIASENRGQFIYVPDPTK